MRRRALEISFIITWIILCLLFITSSIILIIDHFAPVDPIEHWRANAAATKCLLDKVYVWNHTGNDMVYYTVDVKVNYTFMNRNHSIYIKDAMFHEGRLSDLKKYPVGSMQICLVDRDHPGRVVLDYKKDKILDCNISGAMAMIFMIMGIWHGLTLDIARIWRGVNMVL